jgi:hypothetical protein
VNLHRLHGLRRGTDAFPATCLSKRVGGTPMPTANPLVSKCIPNVVREVPALRFSREERFIHLNRKIEVPINIARVESEIELPGIRPIRYGGEQA